MRRQKVHDSHKNPARDTDAKSEFTESEWTLPKQSLTSFIHVLAPVRRGGWQAPATRRDLSPAPIDVQWAAAGSDT